MAGSNVARLSLGSRSVEIIDHPQLVALMQSELRNWYRMHQGRKGEGLAKLAHDAGVSRGTIGRNVDGETHNPTTRTCLLIFFAMGWRIWLTKD